MSKSEKKSSGPPPIPERQERVKGGIKGSANESATELIADILKEEAHQDTIDTIPEVAKEADGDLPELQSGKFKEKQPPPIPEKKPEKREQTLEEKFSGFTPERLAAVQELQERVSLAYQERMAMPENERLAGDVPPLIVNNQHELVSFVQGNEIKTFQFKRNKLLGAGGLGEVFLIENPANPEETYVMKRSRETQDEQQAASFEQREQAKNRRVTDFINEVRIIDFLQKNNVEGIAGVIAADVQEVMKPNGTTGTETYVILENAGKDLQKKISGERNKFSVEVARTQEKSFEYTQLFERREQLIGQLETASDQARVQALAREKLAADEQLNLLQDAKALEKVDENGEPDENGRHTIQRIFDDLTRKNGPVEAIKKMHKLGVLHYDLKTPNLANELIDFGAVQFRGKKMYEGKPPVVSPEYSDPLRFVRHGRLTVEQGGENLEIKSEKGSKSAQKGENNFLQNLEVSEKSDVLMMSRVFFDLMQTRDVPRTGYLNYNYMKHGDLRVPNMEERNYTYYYYIMHGVIGKIKNKEGKRLIPEEMIRANYIGPPMKKKKKLFRKAEYTLGNNALLESFETANSEEINNTVYDKRPSLDELESAFRSFYDEITPEDLNAIREAMQAVHDRKDDFIATFDALFEDSERREELYNILAYESDTVATLPPIKVEDIKRSASYARRQGFQTQKIAA